MSFFTPAEIAELREVQESTFVDLCVITNPEQVSDGESGYVSDWISQGAVACGVSSPSQAAASGLPILDIGSDERQMIFGFPVGTVIAAEWTITWKGREFQVSSLQEPGTYDMQVTAIGLERT